MLVLVGDGHTIDFEWPSTQIQTAAFVSPLGASGRRSSRSLLDGLEPSDPVTLALAVVILSGAGLLAALLPAWHASHVDPSVARVMGNLWPVWCGGPPSLLRSYAAAAFACIHERRLVSLNFASWNRIDAWLRRLDGLRSVA